MSKETTLIRTQWFWRKGESGPELLTAWDEGTIEEWPEGFTIDCERDYDGVRPEDIGYGPRMVNVYVEWDPIVDAFHPVKVKATAVVTS